MTILLLLLMPITDNLAWGLKCDESSGNLLEFVGGLDVTDIGSIGSVTGVVNNGRSFDGVTQRATSSSNSAFQLGNIDWTHIAAVYPTSFSYSIRGTVTAKTDTLTSAEWEDYVRTDGKYACQFNGTVVSSNTLNLNAWNFCVSRYDSVNDVLDVRVNTTYTSQGSMPANTTDSTDFCVGGETTSGPNPYLLFIGYLDELFGFKRYVSNSDLDIIYNGGAWRPYPWTVAAASQPYDLAHQPQHQAMIAMRHRQPEPSGLILPPPKKIIVPVDNPIW